MMIVATGLYDCETNDDFRIPLTFGTRSHQSCSHFSGTAVLNLRENTVEIHFIALTNIFFVSAH